MPNKTGYKYVRATENGKFAACVKVRGMYHYLGRFASPSEAYVIAVKYREDHPICR